ncbi:uncharacterized protein TNCV_4996981 [Trichonephila clavipes]|nr:uncharacterized protein TNCV_4996981 [Trichonephila clavipes]
MSNDDGRRRDAKVVHELNNRRNSYRGNDENGPQRKQGFESGNRFNRDNQSSNNNGRYEPRNRGPSENFSRGDRRHGGRLNALKVPSDQVDKSQSWHWARTRDKASHGPIPIPLGYRGQYRGSRVANKPGLTHVLYHETDTRDKPPVVSRAYRYDSVKQDILDYHVEKMLKGSRDAEGVRCRKKCDYGSACIKIACDFKKQFELFTDASSIRIGAVLNQEQRPIVYASRTLSSAERNYTVTERECLAVIWALKKFKTYLGSLPVKKVDYPVSKVSDGITDGTEFVVGDIENLFDEARRNTKAKHEKWTKYYNRRRRNFRIRVNDWVLLQTHPLSSAARKVVAKFKPKFEGPYRVLEVHNNNLVLWKAGKRLTIIIDQVRLYHQRKSDENELEIRIAAVQGIKRVVLRVCNLDQIGHKIVRIVGQVNDERSGGLERKHGKVQAKQGDKRAYQHQLTVLKIIEIKSGERKQQDQNEIQADTIEIAESRPSSEQIQDQRGPVRSRGSRYQEYRHYTEYKQQSTSLSRQETKRGRSSCQEETEERNSNRKWEENPLAEGRSRWRF